MPITYPTRHTQFMNHAKHTSCSIIYKSLIIPSYSTNTDHLGTNKQPITTLSRPAPRSGWGVSLRRGSLAQARQSRSGESPSAQARARNKEIGTTAGSRLGETPLAWASGSLAQKVEQVAWATYREKEVGEPSSDSLRRARLAWARLTFLALVHLQQMHHSKPTNRAKNSTHPKQWFIYPTTTNLKKTVHEQYNSNPNFSYLEIGSYRTFDA